MSRLIGQKFIIGIDEVGRGPIAGPVTVGAFMVPVKNYNQFMVLVKQLGITDSKKLTAKKREHISSALCDGTAKGLWYFHIAMSSVTVIDKQGIVSGIKKALQKSLDAVMDHYNTNSSTVSVFLDGGLFAPSEYVYQEEVGIFPSKIVLINF